MFCTKATLSSPKKRMGNLGYEPDVVVGILPVRRSPPVGITMATVVAKPPHNDNEHKRETRCAQYIYFISCKFVLVSVVMSRPLRRTTEVTFRGTGPGFQIEFLSRIFVSLFTTFPRSQLRSSSYSHHGERRRL